MNQGKRIAVAALVAMVLAAACWGQATQVVSVPISGRYYESGAGGWLNYTGLVTFTWQKDAASKEWPAKAKLVAEAWCMNTGAGYMLYGVFTSTMKAVSGGVFEVPASILALDGRGQPAFQSRVNVAVTTPEGSEVPMVAAVAVAGE